MAITDLKAIQLFSPDLHSDKRFKGFAHGINFCFTDVASTLLPRLLIYDLDNVRESQLDAFAKNFKLVGYEYLTSYADKLAFCKEGLYLKRVAGTVYAVKTALELTGFTGVVIDENYSLALSYADGLVKANGSVQANGGLSFQGHIFRVGATNMTGNETKATKIIQHYKPASEYLYEVYNY